MIMLLCFSLLILSGEESYVVILKDAKRVEVKGPPVFENGRAVIELLSGEKVALPSGMVDQAATKVFNEEMAKLREQEARLAELREKEKQAAAEAAREARAAREPVVLKRSEDLPDYDDALNTVSGLETEPEDGNQPVAPPYAKSFNSKDPVYVSAERRTRLANGGYRVECDIKVNEVTGAENVLLTFTANFVNEAAEKHTIEVKPAKLEFNQVVTVTFDLTTNDDLFRTEHGISAEIKP